MDNVRWATYNPNDHQEKVLLDTRYNNDTTYRKRDIMNEATFSVTVKVEGDLFTVRGNSAEEFKANLRKVTELDLINEVNLVQEAAKGAPQTFQQAVANVQQSFPGAVEVQQVPQQRYAQPAQQTYADPYAAPQAAPGQQNPTCAHGVRSLVTTKKDGSPLPYGPFWACPNGDRNSQCKPLKA